MKPRSTKPAPRRGEGSVRIIGGRWRGTRLPVPDLPGLRPTSDRARETLFNWLQPVLPGARVLDLFAGSGALGLEALSRGASEALLVERDPGLAESLRTTVERLHAGDEAKPVRADALSLLHAPLHGRFDVVFVDPPFEDALWDAVLAALPPWLADDAWLYLESPADRPVEPGAGWRLHREGGSRDARHALYRRSGGGAATLAQVSDDSATSTP
ncbi:16S rRNA (guanine(966)-N(2))-methyltransferase RsmD [Luteimonas mephitis]|uniref:16S rRNA (guanine(966)-N(2))-methyltransferase RsmD n=1 Tax=Luteimonas mephitis TaxID=83615 RepID=UPI0003FF66A6|nr:16S rRNA (guanine(966)-N(2))-methyltransferase RsmD [Luteimonas mephitis]